MGTGSVAAPPETPAPPMATMPFGARLVNAIVAPRRLFEDLRLKPTWAGVFLLLALLGALFAFAVDRNVGYDRVLQNEMAANPQMQEQIDKVPADQRDQQLRIMAAGYRFTTYGFGVMLLIILAIMAGLYLATMNFGMGATLTYKQVLAIVMWASVPTMVRTLLAVGTLFAGVDTEAFSLQAPVATSPAFFVDRAADPVLFMLGSMLDVFTLWATALTGLGLHVFSRKRLGTCMAVSFGWLAMFAVIFGSVAAMRS